MLHYAAAAAASFGSFLHQEAKNDLRILQMISISNFLCQLFIIIILMAHDDDDEHDDAMMFGIH